MSVVTAAQQASMQSAVMSAVDTRPGQHFCLPLLGGVVAEGLLLIAKQAMTQSRLETIEVVGTTPLAAKVNRDWSKSVVLTTAAH